MMERHPTHPQEDSLVRPDHISGNSSAPHGRSRSQQQSRGRRIVAWTVLVASVLVIVALQNMFWFSLRVIPGTVAAYRESINVEASTSLSIETGTEPPSLLNNAVDARIQNDTIRNTSFISNYTTMVSGEDSNTTRTSPRVVIFLDRSFSPRRIFTGHMQPLDNFTNGTIANTDPPLGWSYPEREPHTAFVLSAMGTIMVDESEEDGRHREFERDWFQKCKPITEHIDTATDDETSLRSKRIFPNCNSFHELDVMADDFPTTMDKRGNISPTESIELLSMQGSWRSVWKVTSTANYSATDSDAPRLAVLKLLQLHRDYNEESYSMHQMDAMVMESLTASPHIVDSYGFCGQSVLTAHAKSSGRNRIKDPKLRWIDRLKLARDLAQGLADLHALEPTSSSTTGKNRPPPLIFAHHDINVANMIAANDGRIQWNDFNLGIIARQHRPVNSTENRDCLVPIRYAGPLWRSPEEIQNQTGYLNNMQAADVYSLGNVLFQVLTKHQPWSHLEFDDNGNNTTGGGNSSQQTPLAKAMNSNDPDAKEKALRMIAQSKMEGRLPNIPDRYLSRTEAQILWNVTQACYQLDPATRPTALAVATILDKAYKKYNKIKKGGD